ncbi:MAG: glycosyltransferase family 2 protein [Acidobacteria bacterium]|nr:glycosyltransferase family 2 protein [Acidobacteriota bacterium]
MTWTLLLLSLRWLCGWWIGGRFPTLAAAAATTARASVSRDASVSVVIPARDEARVLPPLLASLFAQRRQPLDVIVVDDESSDDTAAVAAAMGATVIQPGPPADGWLGKPWACAQGAAQARGDVLVFIDADTTLAPNALDHLVPLVLDSGGLVSVAPYHATRLRYEWASALMNLVAVMGTGASSVWPRATITGAFGPCLAMTRAVYDAIDGHRGVRGDVLEDMAIAQRMRAFGLPVRCVAGGTSVQYRMYPDGPTQLIEGWSKNFASGARHTPMARLLMIVAWMSGLIEAGWLTVIGVTASFVGPTPFPVVHVIFHVLFAVQLWMLLRRIGNFHAASLVHPLLTLAFLLLCANSVRLAWRGRVTWKGRTITANAP